MEINQCVGCSVERQGTGIATPSSRRRVDGVEDDAAIQDDCAVILGFPHRLRDAASGEDIGTAADFCAITGVYTTHVRAYCRSTAPASTLSQVTFMIEGCSVRNSTCMEINQCVGCTRQFFTKSFLGDDAAVLARSSGEDPATPRHRAASR